ncbi:MAG: 3-methylornithine--L-lysine ligase PylC [Eubacteriales bacterium]
MSRLAIIGGKLQGIEACYLAGKAGIQTLLIDKNPDAPARGLCTEFINVDILLENRFLMDELCKCDLVLPALENQNVLDHLVELSQTFGFILAFDPKAYAISSSKIESDKLIHKYNLPSPAYFPNGQVPYVAKPSNGSGSDGVKILNTISEVELFLAKINSENGKKETQDWIVQEYVSGPSYSIEVIGSKAKGYKTYKITEIFVDKEYDCNKVTSYVNLDKKSRDEFSQLGRELAALVDLDGIMDVEVILNNGELKILEIDARFPSQTPTVVLQSTGENLIVELIRHFCKKKFVEMTANEKLESNKEKKELFVSFEHFLVENGAISQPGEHIIGEAGKLQYIEGFCHADEALTDFNLSENRTKFCATMINKADSLEELESKLQIMRGELEKLVEKQNE